MVISFHDYTSFIGPNGAGKSSILHSLEWFFDKRELTDKDINFSSDAEGCSVSLTFEHLLPHEKHLLGRFGRGDCASFRRYFDMETGKSSYTGSVLCGPGFSNVLAMTRAPEYRPAYEDLKKRFPALKHFDTPPNKSEIEDALLAWEAEPANRHQLVTIDDEPADRVFETDGAIFQLVHFLLIDGAMDISSELSGGTKTSLLNVLTDRLISTAKNSAVADWESANSDALQQLMTATRTAVNEAVREQTQRINSSLSRYIPGAIVEFEPSTSNVAVQTSTSISTRLRMGNGVAQEVSIQGHGTQRAVIMSMVEAIHSQFPDHGETSPLVILAAEEPEIYQHPVRARSFARTLSALAKQEQFQVIIATHSSHFVSADFIDSLRFVRNIEGVTDVASSSAWTLSKIRNKHIEETREWLYKEVPASFTDAFFGSMIVLVEGDTDTELLTEAADFLQTPFDHFGIVCIDANGKKNIPMYRDVLASFRIPIFVIVDGDYYDDTDPRKTVEQITSYRNQTEACVRDLKLLDENNASLYVYGQVSWCSDGFAFYQTDLETELESWPSYLEAKERVNKRNDAKNAYRYRRATREAKAHDMPVFLRTLIQSIIQKAQLPT